MSFTDSTDLKVLQAAVAMVSRPNGSMRSLLGLWLMLSLVSGCGQGTPEDRIKAARDAQSLGKYGQALKLISNIKEGDPYWNDALYIRGQIQVSQGRPDKALVLFNQIPGDGSRISLDTARVRAELSLGECDVLQALRELKYVQKHSPEDRTAASRIGNILNNAGLFEMAAPYLFEDLKAGTISIADLVSLTVPDRPRQGQNMMRCGDSPDPYLQSGIARSEMNQQRYAEARSRLWKVVRRHPEISEAQAMLGELCLEESDAEFRHWDQQIPETLKNDAGICFVRGLHARRLGQLQVAARCFWNAARNDPPSRRAQFQLSQVLASSDPEISEAFAERAALLKKCGETLEKMLISEGKDKQSFLEIIQILRDVGRDWEAQAWAKMARDRFGVGTWADDLYRELMEITSGSPTRFQPDRDLTVRYDLSNWPDYESLRLHESKSDSPSAVQGRQAVQFAEIAEARGIRFNYFQSPDPQSKEVRIFESTGGGVGAFDYDLDGAVDLIFTQGEPWPARSHTPSPSTEYEDCLYRQSGDAFMDCSVLAGLQPEGGYGQGCSCGDYNNDGFPDLYIANIGRNRLLLNNGDGTFTDQSESCGINDTSWTTSCLILDLNNDGNPDIYDVNYLQGDEVFTVECSTNRCSVRNFQGAPDKVWLSQGDGSFREVPDATPKALAKGLGIVAIYETPRSLPSLFIANDQVPNFYLHPLAVEGTYEDQAVARGLATNMNGESTAAMGVAAGDINADQLTDLFVTNFETEANCMYLQHDGGLFEDAVISTGLRGPSVKYVGWGTQFLDADNNGELDLVVANGHVADFGQKGVQYKMPVQFFESQGLGRFLEHDFPDTDRVFNEQRLGRSLATCDWNHDGRIDFVISNIAAPAVLAENQTVDPGHWLSVRLRARHSARDAVGATVTLTVGDKLVTHQLLAGDGYQATNERLIHFGLGEQDSIDELTVNWPSGEQTVVTAPAADCEIWIAEGAKTCTVRKRDRLVSLPVRR